MVICFRMKNLMLLHFIIMIKPDLMSGLFIALKAKDIGVLGA